MIKQETVLALFIFASHALAFSPLPAFRHGLNQRSFQDERQSETPPATLLDPIVAVKQPKRRIPWTLDQDQKHIDIQQAYAWGFSSIETDTISTYQCQNVEGTVPCDLQGTLYRNGAGNFERGGRRVEHIFDGDGFVSAFTFKDGKVRYSGNFVQTEAFKKEQQADRFLHRNSFGTEPNTFLEKVGRVTVKNPANLNALEWGGRLFALWEAGRAYELDPDTLETIDYAEDGLCGGIKGDDGMAMVTIDEGGVIDRLIGSTPAVTAHPHRVDDDTLVYFETRLHARTDEVQLDFIECNSKWEEKSRVTTKYNGQVYPHDFVVTDDYYVFFEPNQDFTGIGPFALGVSSLCSCIKVNFARPTYLQFVPRRSGVEGFKVQTPSHWSLHMPPTVQVDGSKISIYSQGYEGRDQQTFPVDRPISLFSDWGGYCPKYQNAPISRLFRTTIDMDTKECIGHDEVIPGLCIDQPTVDEDNSRYIYGVSANTESVPLPPSGFVRVDTETDTAQYWWAEPGVFVGEPVETAKQNGDKGSWVMALACDSRNERTSLVILDSENFEDGPVGRVHLAHYMGPTIHGSFSKSVLE